MKLKANDSYRNTCTLRDCLNLGVRRGIAFLKANPDKYEVDEVGNITHLASLNTSVTLEVIQPHLCSWYERKGVAIDNAPRS